MLHPPRFAPGYADSGLLIGASAWVVASGAAEEIRSRATIAKAFYGDLIGICDGTDDDVQIQAAIDALSSAGGIVQLSTGVFNTTSTITLDSNGQVVQGMGPQSTRVDFSTGSGAAFELGAGTTLRQRIMLKDMFIRPRTDGQNAITIDSNRQGLVENVAITGIASPTSGVGVLIKSTQVGGNRGTLRNVRMLQMFKGIEVSGDENVNDWTVFGGHVGGFGTPPSGSIGVDLQVGDTMRFFGFSIEDYETHFKTAQTATQLFGVRMESGTTGVEVTGDAENFLMSGGSITNMSSAKVSDSGTNSRFTGVNNFIARGERRILQGTLSSGSANDFAFAEQNPEAVAVAVTKVLVDVTTAGGTASALINVGSAADATTGSDNLIDGADINTTALYDNLDDAGTNGESKQRLDAKNGSTDHVTGQIVDQDATNLAGNYVIEYMALESG
jgi:hypothetical protein